MNTSRHDRTFSAKERFSIVADIARGELDPDDARSQMGIRAPTLQIWVDEVLRTAKSELNGKLHTALGRTASQTAQGTEFAGSLSDFPPGDLVQMLSLSQSSAKMVVTTPSETHRLWLSDGQVVAAASGALEGEDAAYRILCQREGRFSVSFGAFDPATASPCAIDASTQSLLLSGACHADEGQRLLDLLPPAVAILITVGAPPPGLSDSQARVLSMFESGATLEEVLMLSGLGQLATIERIAELWERGDLETTDDTRSIETNVEDVHLATMESLVLPEPHEACASVASPDHEAPQSRRSLLGKTSGGVIGLALAATLGVVALADIESSVVQPSQVTHAVAAHPSTPTPEASRAPSPHSEQARVLAAPTASPPRTATARVVRRKAPRRHAKLNRKLARKLAPPPPPERELTPSPAAVESPPSELVPAPAEAAHEASLPSVSAAPAVDPTEAPVDATEAPVDATEPPARATTRQAAAGLEADERPP
ncbi:MAG: DUF4388 domain-containing protein [Nannocystaceae bacterium]